ncbi:MAG TPA: putative phage abortive infection protein [Beijerinckiaceae bacterium]
MAWIIGLIAVVIWTIWAAQKPVLEYFGKTWDPQALGLWGDSFGALNALVAAVGFVMVVASLRLQRQQNRAAQEDQHRQRFDTSYFELLHLVRATRDETRFRYSDEYILHHNPTAKNTLRTGLDAFRFAWREAIAWLGGRDSNLTPEEAGALYEKHIHKRYESRFGPYFRLIYTILDRVKSDPLLTGPERHRYGNLLRSQLTSYEIALLGLNGLSPVSKDLKDLIVEFHLLKYLPAGTRRETLEKFYPPEAFVGRD